MADIDKRAQNRQEYVDDIVERLFSSTMDHNARGKLGRYTGKGYTGDNVFINNMPQGVRRFWGEMKTARRKSPVAVGDYKLDPSEVANLNDIEDWKMKKVNQFSESTFTNQQMDAVRNISVDPTDDTDTTLGQIIRAKLMLNASKAMERKLINTLQKEDQKIQSPKELSERDREGIRERADALIASPRFNRVVDVLTKKYTTPNEKGQRPKLEQSDFSPYIWGAPDLQTIYSRSGQGNILDRIDDSVVPDTELPGTGVDREKFRREYAKQKIKALQMAIDGGGK